MLVKSLAYFLVLASSFVTVLSQIPDAKKELGSDKTAKTTDRTRVEKLRDLTLPSGVDLQFLIMELAREMDLNVLFDPESFRTPGRRTFVDLKNVTAQQALHYVLLQERLISEEVGPRTIIVAAGVRGTSIPQIGVGLTPLTEQLAQYFGVDGGVLIDGVRPDSTSSKAGLKAGDVIVGIDGEPVRGALVVIRFIDAKTEDDFTLRIVRDRRDQTVTVIRQKASP